MPTNDPYCRIQQRGWVGEGEGRALPDSGRWQAEGLTEGAIGQRGVAGMGPTTAFGGPPPRNGEDLDSDQSVFTPALKLRFLDALAQHGNVRVAAARVGVLRSGVYLVRRRDGAFAAGWIAALGQARFHAEAVLAERALDGVEEPVFYHGEVIAVRRRFDTRLLLAHLARLDALCGAEGAGQANGGEVLDFDLALARIAGLEQPGGGAPLSQSRAACLAAAAECAGAAYDRTAPQVDPDDPECYDPGAKPWYENDAIRAAEEEAAIYEAALDTAEAHYAAARAERIAAAEAEAAAKWDARSAASWAAVDAVRLGLSESDAPLEVKSANPSAAFLTGRTLSTVSIRPGAVAGPGPPVTLRLRTANTGQAPAQEYAAMIRPATFASFAFAGLLGATLAACSPGQAAPPPAPSGRGVQVIELFQSQGCSSCPPANANVMALADRPGVLTLSWQVTYWDYLGWKDSFAQAAFTARQRAYAGALGHDGVFTPQVVVNGRGDVVGAARGEVEQALRRFDRGGDGVIVTLGAGQVTVAGNSAASSVYLVRYDPRIVQIPIKAGENGGRTLPHRNVVREFALLGRFSGGTHSFTLSASKQAGLKTAVLVQSGVAGPIVAAVHS